MAATPVDNRPVILIDRHDRESGSTDIVTAHRGVGRLHRAFTVFLFNDEGKTLAVRRSPLKPLWPLYWDGACSSHQKPGETTIEAARRRLTEELELTAQDLEYVFQYEYHAVYSPEWSENEINHIVIGKTNANPIPDPNEVETWDWRTPDEIDAELARPDHKFAPWFPLAWVRLKNRLGI